MRIETVARVIPFAVFMAIIGVGEALSMLARLLNFSLPGQDILYLYPIRAITAGILLWVFRSRYSELSFSDLGRPMHTLLSILLGILVFIVWITLNLPFTLTPSLATGYDPTLFPEGGVRMAMISVRVVGAVIIVPIMEELFWRSFLTRYLISNSFTTVEIGTFTLSSFLITSVLFGLEHNLIIAGILAGIIYNAILFYTKNLSQCVLSHLITNALLAGYVIFTNQWSFW
jgi:hypothetical protein